MNRANYTFRAYILSKKISLQALGIKHDIQVDEVPGS